jgi:hypothetical protein
MKYVGNCAELINWNDVIDSIKDLHASTDICDPKDLSPTLSAEENEATAIRRIKEQEDLYFDEMSKTKGVDAANILRSKTENTLNSWIDAGYKYSEITWEDYYVEKFPTVLEASNIFTGIINATPIPGRVFITRLKPGKVAPWHYDVLPDISEYKKLGSLVRFVCFIQEPIPGHTFSFNNITYYNESVGNIYEWTNVDDYHSAANSSLQPFYMFHWQGYR